MPTTATTGSSAAKSASSESRSGSDKRLRDRRRRAGGAIIFPGAIVAMFKERLVSLRIGTQYYGTFCSGADACKAPSAGHAACAAGRNGSHGGSRPRGLVLLPRALAHSPCHI